MQKPKRAKKIQKSSVSIDWFKYVNDDNLRLAIPIGPRFQAHVPDWTGPPHKKYPHSAVSESDSSKWLGTRVWPTKDNRPPKTQEDAVGQGRPMSCLCFSPGSAECVKRHVTDKIAHLRIDLGTAFWKWKFDEMGEEVSKLWNQKDQKKFASLVKMNPLSQGKTFMRPALKAFPSKCRKKIVNYYFNVYLPRRMGLQTRSGCRIVDTDDEEDDDPRCKGSGKRCRADNSPNLVKNRYLAGRR